jgi:hypothetical protein
MIAGFPLDFRGLSSADRGLRLWASKDFCPVWRIMMQPAEHRAWLWLVLMHFCCAAGPRAQQLCGL